MSRDLLELSRMRDMVAGGLVKSLRLSAGLSLSEVAADIGVTPACVHHWENGKRIPRGEAAVRYARLHCQLEEMARR